VVEKTGRRLMYLRHTWMDVFRVPLVLSGLLLIFFALIYLWKPDTSIWTSGLMIGALIFCVIGIPGMVAVALWMWGTHKDEELWIEGDHLIYKHGEEVVRVKMEDINRIDLGYARVSQAIYFYFKRRYGKYRGVIFGENIFHRQWITPEELERKGIEMWNIVRQHNPCVKLWRKFPKRKYLERWNGREWEKIDWGEIRREVMGGRR
jgi:hypothetical protein